MQRATQTKDLRFGSTERADYVFLTIDCQEGIGNRNQTEGQQVQWPDMVVVRGAYSSRISFGWQPTPIRLLTKGKIMKVIKNERGFPCLMHNAYLPNEREERSKLAAQSSAVGDYHDSFDRPGTSFLWIGYHHHLNREEVRQFIKHLQAWVDTGSLNQ